MGLPRRGRGIFDSSCGGAAASAPPWLTTLATIGIRIGSRGAFGGTVESMAGTLLGDSRRLVAFALSLRALPKPVSSQTLSLVPNPVRPRRQLNDAGRSHSPQAGFGGGSLAVGGRREFASRVGGSRSLAKTCSWLKPCSGLRPLSRCSRPLRWDKLVWGGIGSEV